LRQVLPIFRLLYLHDVATGQVPNEYQCQRNQQAQPATDCGEALRQAQA
jgi:hypothetical protein